MIFRTFHIPLILLFILNGCSSVYNPDENQEKHLFPIYLDACRFEGKGFIDQNGKIVIPPEYDRVYSFSEGLATACKNNKCGCIDKDNNVVIDFKYDNIFSFKEGIAPFVMNEKVGLIDKTGKIIAEPQYKYIRESCDGWARVCLLENGHEVYNYINNRGELLLPKNVVEAYDFQNGIANIKRAFDWDQINTRGEYVTYAGYNNYFNFSESLAPVWVNGKYGYINRLGILRIEPKYDVARQFKFGVAAVSFNDDYTLRHFIIDKYGTVISEIPEPAQECFEDGLLKVYVSKDKDDYNSTFTFVNITGRKFSRRVFKRVGRFNEGMAEIFDSKGKFGYIDNKGKYAIRPKFDRDHCDCCGGHSFHNGLAFVHYDDIQGYVNKRGIMVWKEKRQFYGPCD